MSNVTPFLWFDDNAEEAVNFYVSLFPGSKIMSISRYPDGGPAPKRKVLTVTFDLDGQRFIALNGGPTYQLTDAFSLHVNVETQAELDALWDKLLAGGGRPSRCGWLKDRFGLSWQVIPSVLGRLMADPDPEKSKRVVQAMLAMVKLDIGALQRAHDKP